MSTERDGSVGENPARISDAARAVVAYWDSLDAVPSDDSRATEEFAAEMDRRINELREALA